MEKIPKASNSRHFVVLVSFLLSSAAPEVKAQQTATSTCLVSIPTSRSLTDGAARSCVTSVDVNRAYARALAKVPAPPGNSSDPALVGVLGDLFQATTEELLREMVGLSPEAAAAAFPRIDVARTSLSNLCPNQFRPGGVTCSSANERFRRIDGYCTQGSGSPPHFGASGRTLRRELPDDYADGLSAPRVSVDGSKLPSARLVSNAIHPRAARNEQFLNVMFLAFGQFLDHEVTLTGNFAKNPSRADGKIECCSRQEHRTCLGIEIPRGDPFYSRFNTTCLNFQRVLPGLEQGCSLGPRNQFNADTPVIDASAVYGSTQSKANRLRDLSSKGRLRTFSPPGSTLKPLLPQKTTEPSVDCVIQTATSLCFEAGDDRASEQPLLTSVHVIFLRAHNAFAAQLATLNPSWDPERVYQEARRIVGAVLQHIVLNEYLPALLPANILDYHTLRPQPLFRTTGYDPTLDPQISQSFATAAFRFAHSLLPDQLILSSNTHTQIGSLPLRSLLNRPDELYKPGRVDQLLLGGLNQPADAFDQFISEEVRNFLFQEPNQAFGMDLAARNIQRGREHGVPGYTAFRELCGLRPINSWADMSLFIPNATVATFSQLYKYPVDVDLWTAGISETRAPGTILGPTFACLIGEQFSRLMYGDRFWYEYRDFPSSFTQGQLAEIKKMTFARLLCDHGDSILTVQKNAFLLPNFDTNARVACGSAIIPQMNLTPWKEGSTG